MYKRNELSANKHAALKARCIAILGGKCLDCGLVSEYQSVYDFHHIDPTQKDFNVSKGLSRKWDKTAAELSKCVLLCCLCHRIRHEKEDNVKESYQKFDQPMPKQSYSEGKGQPNDHCAANNSCPEHKMNDHLTKDSENGKNSTSSKTTKVSATNADNATITDMTIGATYNE